MVLKVHKIENFFDSDFGICVISLLLCINNKILEKIFLIGPLWGELRLFRVVLGLHGMKKNFKDRPKIFFLKSYMTLNYLLIRDFQNSNH